jgi:hypothetical protein
MKLKSLSRFLIPVFCSSLLLFCQCKKDNDGPGVDAGNGTLTMTIDGTSWTSKDTDNGAIIIESQGTLTLQAFATDDSQISFGLPTPTQGSTWDFSNGGSMGYKLNTTDIGYAFIPGFGNAATITFTTFNSQKAKGTFSATLVKFDNMGNPVELNITNGNFDLNF